MKCIHPLILRCSQRYYTFQPTIDLEPSTPEIENCAKTEKFAFSAYFLNWNGKFLVQVLRRGGARKHNSNSIKLRHMPNWFGFGLITLIA